MSQELMTSRPAPAIDQYEELLVEYGVRYSKDGDYLICNEMEEGSTWILYVSTIVSQTQAALRDLLPLLQKLKTAFKIPKNDDCANTIAKGRNGKETFAKMITIHPNNLANLNDFVDALKMITGRFNGPVIPDVYSLGNNVFAEYTGSSAFNSNLWPFKTPIPKTPKEHKRVMFGKYIITDVLKEDFKGKVFYGWYLTKYLTIKSCVIKEGKKFMNTDNQGRSIKDRLQWQRQLQNELQGSILLPKVVDLITYNGDMYFIMQYIKGVPLDIAIRMIYKKPGNLWHQLKIEDQRKLIGYLIAVINIINIIHKKGYVHRDATPNNFIVNKKGQIVSVDMELTYSINSNYPYPPFAKGTPGFMSPQQMKLDIPTTSEDIYAMGGMLTYFFTALNPEGFAFTDEDKLREQLVYFIEDSTIVNLILSCYKGDANQRPTLEVLLSALKAYQQDK